MADNLNIAIGVDTSKLRLGLELAKGDLRTFGREVRQAVDQHDIARAEDLSKKYEATSNAVRRLQDQIRQAHRVLADTSPWQRATEHLMEFSRRSTELGRGLNEMATKTIPGWKTAVEIGFL